ncbi:MAG: endonuclease/exonuclease/phosphatase family protein [Betaproteobacteria bacterium]
MTQRITLATYNIHKGLSPLNRKLVIHEVRDKLHSLKADILLLQEVQGAHTVNKSRFVDWPDLPQHEHLAEGRYRDIVYGLNANNRHGHHGNAILSAFPVVNWTNQDVSHHRYENRGHLMARIDIPGWTTPLTCVCVHLGLFQRSRAMQIERLAEFLRDSAPGDAPLIVAGDFNDWRAKKSGVSDSLFSKLGLEEAFELTHGKPARTFPAFLPMLTIDRVYVRGLSVHQAQRLYGTVDGTRWRGLSDHAGLSVTVSRKHPG